MMGENIKFDWEKSHPHAKVLYAIVSAMLYCMLFRLILIVFSVYSHVDRPHVRPTYILYPLFPW